MKLDRKQRFLAPSMVTSPGIFRSILTHPTDVHDPLHSHCEEVSVCTIRETETENNHKEIV